MKYWFRHKRLTGPQIAEIIGPTLAAKFILIYKIPECAKYQAGIEWANKVASVQ